MRTSEVAVTTAGDPNAAPPGSGQGESPGAKPSQLSQPLAREAANKQGHELRNPRAGEVLERLAREKIDGLLRHDPAILELDVSYLGGDELEHIGIE
jgi:hypothetical protein